VPGTLIIYYVLDPLLTTSGQHLYVNVFAFYLKYSNPCPPDGSAIPIPLGALYEHQPDNDAERTNKKAFTTSLDEANRQIGNMKEVLKNPNDPRIRTAFGPNANHAEISRVVDTLGAKKLKVQSMDPNMADTEAGRAVNAFVPMNNGAPQSARFGSTFFCE
jgi:hypothetical protein